MGGIPLAGEQGEKKDWEKYEETIEKFIQVIAKNMNLYGMTPSVGRLYGVLYFSDEPMTLDGMRDALEMSKTSMSTGVRVLSDRKSTRLNSSHVSISYAVFCLKKKKTRHIHGE